MELVHAVNLTEMAVGLRKDTVVHRNWPGSDQCNASAVSVDSIKSFDSGWRGISFRPTGTDKTFRVGFISGLVDSLDVLATAEVSCIDFAVCCASNGQLSVHERDARVVSLGTYATDCRIQLSLNKSQLIEYRMDGELRHTSSVPPTCPLHLKLCAYHSGPLLQQLEWIDDQEIAEMGCVGVWDQVPSIGDIFSPRTGHAAACSCGTLFLFGGCDETGRRNDIHTYDAKSDRWTLLPASGNLPPARSGAQIIVFLGSIWVFGGYTGHGGEYFNDVFRFNLQTGKWESVEVEGKPPRPRTDHGVALFRGSLLVCGGYDGQHRFSDLHELHLQEQRWSRLSSEWGIVPSARCGHTVAIHSDSLLVYGGWDGHGMLGELLEYVITTSTWSELPARGTRPPASYRHSAVVYGDVMFVFGGLNEQQVRIGELYEYDLTLREWALLETNCGPSPRTFHKAVTYEGHMYVLGGFNGKRLNDVYRVRVSQGPVKILTLRALLRGSGGLTLCAMSTNGSELESLEIEDPSKETVRAFREMLNMRFGQRLRLLLPEGRVLSSADDATPLAELLGVRRQHV